MRKNLFGILFWGVFLFASFTAYASSTGVLLQNGAGQEAGTVAYPLEVKETYSYRNITTTGNVFPDTTPGIIHTFTINKPVANGVFIIADGSTATPIATITLPATLLEQGPQTMLLDVAYGSSLNIYSTVTSDMTVTYK